MEYKISLITHIRDSYPQDKCFTFEGLKEFFSNFIISSKENAPGFISGHYGGKKRLTENLHGKSIIILDLDSPTSDICRSEEVFRRNISPYKYITYSTGSYGSKGFRVRVLLFLEKEVDTKQYKAIALNVIKTFDDEFQKMVDISSSISPNHTMYLPIKPSDDYIPWYEAQDGKIINPDNYLPSKRDRSESRPTSAAEDELLITVQNEPLAISDKEVISFLKEYPVGDKDYHSWLEVGAALHHQYKGENKGLSIWDEWSKQDTRADQYMGIDHLKEKWNTFFLRKSDPVTFATIIYKVREQRQSRLSNLKEGTTTPKPIDRTKWMHTKGKHLTPKFTEANFLVLLENYNIDIKFDIIKKETCICFDGLKEKNINSAITRMELLAHLNDLPREMISKTVDLMAHNNQINSWKTWVESTPWDGTDRFSSFCDTISVDNEYIKIRDLYLKKWLLQMLHVTCLNDNEDPKTGRMVLIFNGSQHIGKTSWFRALVPSSMRDYVIEGKTLNVADSMDVLSCIQHVMVELGEMASTMRKSDQEQLKGFLSNTRDTLNIKYVAHPVKYRRHTVFFGSVNDTTFLQDQTGNTRFLTLAVKSCNANHNINMQQLYAQVLEEARLEEDYNLNVQDLKSQRELNSEFENISPLEEKFEEIFDLADENRNTLYNATKVLEELGFNIAQLNFKKNTINEMARILDNHGFKRNSKPKGWYLPPKRVRDVIF